MPRWTKTLEERFWEKVGKRGPLECWPWLAATDSNGYGVFRGRHSRFAKAQRQAYELCVGPIPEGMHVLHKCDNTHCVNPGHLFLGTPTDNMQDCKKKGRMGRKNKLCFDDANNIRKAITSGQSRYAIAAQYTISLSTIRDVWLKKVWKGKAEVPSEPTPDSTEQKEHRA